MLEEVTVLMPTPHVLIPLQEQTMQPNALFVRPSIMVQLQQLDVLMLIMLPLVH